MLKQAFPPIANQHSKILLLGTMPGEQSLKLQQYYGHKGNQFWKIIFALFNEPLVHDYETKKALLLSKGIAVWDVLQYCEREGSADSKIQKEVPNDFASFYSKHPQVKQVFFTSTKAMDYYDTYVKREPGYNYHLLPSTSSANTWKTVDEKLNEWKIILKYL
jgi:hypoxanthine-DNA glycosylase